MPVNASNAVFSTTDSNDNWDDQNWSDIGDDLNQQDSSSQDQNGSSFATNPLIATIQDLEKNGLGSYNLDEKKKTDYLKELDEALGYLQGADKLKNKNQIAAADHLEKEGKSKYDEVMQDLKLSQPDSGSDSNSVASFSQDKRNALADEFDAMAKKIGYVRYNFKEEDNVGMDIAANALVVVATFGLTARNYKDYSVNSTFKAPYSAGYDLHEKETGMDTGDGGHAHGWGTDGLNKERFKKLESQGRVEANSAKSALHAMAQALRESDPTQQQQLWNKSLDALITTNQSNAPRVAHAAQLVLNVMRGELGDSPLTSAIQAKAIPQEVFEKLSQMIQSRPKEEEFKGKDYITGGNGSDYQNNLKFLENAGVGLNLSIAGDSTSPDSTKTTNDEKKDDHSSDSTNDNDSSKNKD